MNQQQSRIYTMDGRGMSAEEIAVTFARTSRSPEPFDEIAAKVTEDNAAEFNERWVVGYGHASVAEHAVVHLAMENVSRLAADAVEEARLASYTEKSSRYQVIDGGSFHQPDEISGADHQELAGRYANDMTRIFEIYAMMVTEATERLKTDMPRQIGESGTAWALRRRRAATDAVRNVLPAATLTNVGMTANARQLEHMCSKLMSAGPYEERMVGAVIRDRGREVAPTLLKYADHNPFLAWRESVRTPGHSTPAESGAGSARLVRHETDARERLLEALAFRQSGDASKMDIAAEVSAIAGAMSNHDQPPREFEMVHYTMEFTMDYGALREFRRHRMMTPISQPLTIGHGCHVPDLIVATGQEPHYLKAIAIGEELHAMVAREVGPMTAQYTVSHGHLQKILVSLNLRELHHLVKLRTSEQAHPSIRVPVREALRLVHEVHPELVAHLWDERQ